MDDWIIYLIFAAGLPLVIALAANARAGRALRELAAVRAALAAMVRREAAREQVSPPVPEVEAAPEPVVVEPVAEEVIPEEVAAAAAMPEPPQPLPEPKKIDIEALLTQRWGVWLGSVALLFAGVFLVRYAVEHELLGPGLRCGIAALFGVALLAGAEWLLRHPAADLPGPFHHDQTPAGLAAGGAAMLFGAAYGAGVFFALVPPSVGFVLMAAAAVVGLLASLRFGPLTAAVGVAGAFATPALVTVADPSLPGLFAYLVAVTAASLGVVRYTAWTWLGWAAVAGGVFWVIASIGVPSVEYDAWSPALYVVLAAGLNLFLLPPAALETLVGRRLAWIPFAALGVAGLVLEIAVAGTAPRAALFLLSPLAVAKGVTEQRLDRLPWLAALFGLLALLAWALPAWNPTGEVITTEGLVQAILPGDWAPGVIVPLLTAAGIFAAFHAVFGLWAERRGRNPLRWSALVAAVPVLTLAVTYAQVARFQADMAWAAAALALTAALTATATRAISRQQAGVHAAGAVAALVLGCAMLLHDHWLTLAFSLFLPPLAWIEAKAELPQLRPVASAVATLVLVRLLLNWNVFGYALGDLPLANGLIAAYAVPAASFVAAGLMFRRRGDDRTVRLLEGGAATLLAAFVALEIRHAVTGGAMTQPGSFTEAALDVLTLALQAWGYLVLAQRTGRVVARVAWRIFGVAALFFGALLILANPAVTNARAGAATLLCGYLLPAAVAVAMRRMLAGVRRQQKLLGGYALVSGFVWIFLQIRVLFHPNGPALWRSGVEDAELWAWSGAWLAYGIALMAGGIWGANREVRMAALGIIALVSAKVFLVDMSDLAGLWRVVSFLGLGLVLIALGAIYRRFVLPAPGS